MLALARPNARGSGVRGADDDRLLRANCSMLRSGSWSKFSVKDTVTCVHHAQASRKRRRMLQVVGERER
jgi:hypothetical protein